MQNDKIQALIHHILRECEAEGLTIQEVKKLPQKLQNEICERLLRMDANSKFTNPVDK